MTIQVTQCENCPFGDSRVNEYFNTEILYCNRLKRDVIKLPEAKVPNTCPLLTSDINVTLKL